MELNVCELQSKLTVYRNLNSIIQSRYVQRIYCNLYAICSTVVYTVMLSHYTGRNNKEFDIRLQVEQL
jgi:hypothetical protein